MIFLHRIRETFLRNSRRPSARARFPDSTRAVTADDFLYSFNRIISPDAASPGRYSLFKFAVIGRGSDANYVGLQEIELYGSLSDGTVILIR